MKQLLSIVMLLAVVAALPPPALYAKDGGTRWVAIQNAGVRAGASMFSRKVGSLAYAEEVAVLREENGWTEVRSAAHPKVKGWISASALSRRRLVDGSFSANAGELALAGKGFSEETEREYRAGGNADYAAVDAMEAEVLSTEDVRSFMAGGKLDTGAR